MLLIKIFIVSLYTIKIFSSTDLDGRTFEQIAYNSTIHEPKIREYLQLKPLLCVVFLKASKSQIDVLYGNMLLLSQQCDWAVMIYEGTSKALSNHFPKITNLHHTKIINLLLTYSELKGNSSHLNNILKPFLYMKLRAITHAYKRIWLLDDDLSVTKFNLKRYINTVTCMFYPYSGQLPLISQGLITGHFQHFEYVNVRNWTNSSVLASASGFVEQQAPFIHAPFFNWFLDYIISPMLPLVKQLEVDWGFDCVWCSAAAIYARNVLNESRADRVCAIVTAPNTELKHLHTSWTTLFAAKGGKKSQKFWDEMNLKLQRSNELMSRLKMSFPTWYKSGESNDVSPHYRYPNNGTYKWERVEKIDNRCDVL